MVGSGPKIYICVDNGALDEFDWLTISLECDHSLASFDWANGSQDPRVSAVALRGQGVKNVRVHTIREKSPARRVGIRIDGFASDTGDDVFCGRSALSVN